MIAESQQAEAVIAHTDETRARQAAMLDESYDDILELARGADWQNELVYIGSFVRQFRKNRALEDMSAPTLATMMVRDVWSDLCDQYPHRQSQAEIEDRKYRAANLAGNFILPMANIVISQPPVVESNLYMGLRPSCSDAENKFNSARKQALTGKGIEHSRVSVYHDRECRPIVLRKQERSSTGLTLEPIRIGRVIVPKGSIVAFGGRAQDETITGETQTATSTQASYLIDSGFQLRPIRLSAWAYQGLDKLTYAIRCNLSCNTDRLEMLDQCELSDFRNAAANIMRRCGVEPSLIASSQLG